MYVVMKTTFRKICPVTLFAMVIFLSFPAPVFAQKNASLGVFGDWDAYKETDGGKPVCYIGSQPKRPPANTTNAATPIS